MLSLYRAVILSNLLAAGLARHEFMAGSRPACALSSCLLKTLASLCRRGKQDG
jgi:hypothetical protein